MIREPLALCYISHISGAQLVRSCIEACDAFPKASRNGIASSWPDVVIAKALILASALRLNPVVYHEVCKPMQVSKWPSLQISPSWKGPWSLSEGMP